MKKKNYLFMTIVMCVLLISCGGKTEKKDGSTAEITTSESDVPLNELNIRADFEYDSYTTQNIKRNDEKENFTGLGVEKDQNDSILNIAEVKNGWLIRYTHRIKADNRYITISDFTFDNGEIKDGFKKEINDKYDPKICYVQSVKSYKNGKNQEDLAIKIRTEEKIVINGRYDENANWIGENISSMTVKNFCTGSNREKQIDVLKLKCLSNFKKDYGSEKSGFESDSEYEYNAIKYYENADEKIIFKTLDDMKKELPKFDYWKK
ncbi:MAG: hypothetical protein ACOYLP_02560 [Flavobacterium sp.]|jgi:hypothetical protein|uniref:hypothetical protein n=1 Tax=Flavobacterium sp. TaxID=239 RepID=UPI003BD845E9